VSSARRNSKDGAGRFGAAFEAVVGFLEGLEAGEKAGLEILRALCRASSA